MCHPVFTHIAVIQLKTRTICTFVVEFFEAYTNVYQIVVCAMIVNWKPHQNSKRDAKKTRKPLYHWSDNKLYVAESLLIILCG